MILSSIEMGKLEIPETSRLSLTGAHRYLVVPGFLSEDQTNSLMVRTKELLDDFTLENHPLVSIRYRNFEPYMEPQNIIIIVVVDQIHDIRQGPRRRRLLPEFRR